MALDEAPPAFSLYACLDRIEKRPELYVRGPAFDALQNFLFGYEDARCHYSTGPADEHPPFDEFGDFVAARIGKREDIDPALRGGSVLHGGGGDVVVQHPEPLDFDLILSVAGSKEGAVTLFFKLLADYRAGTA